MEEETNKNMIWGKVLTSTQHCQGALECKLHLSLQASAKEKP